jgi:AcrR family transcriptional regulator
MSGVKRQYRQTDRAEQTAATRRRIVEAAVQLHGTVGPANTSLSAIAREAGVSRPTVYAHFPDEASLFKACTLHWMAQDPPPDPARWSVIDDPRERLRTALTQLYSHYARNEQLIENVFRDMYLVDSMRSFNVPLIEGSFAQIAAILSSAFDDRPDAARRREAMADVAIRFDTWKLLVRDRGLPTEDAVEIMAHAVNAAGTP